MKNGRRRILIIVVVVVVAFAAFLFFPRKRDLKDGGTTRYESFGFGVFYCVEHRHRIYEENGIGYYEVGTLVTVFGNEVYNNVHVDYDNSFAEPSPEQIESLNAAIESAMSE